MDKILKDLEEKYNVVKRKSIVQLEQKDSLDQKWQEIMDKIGDKKEEITYEELGIKQNNYESKKKLKLDAKKKFKKQIGKDLLTCLLLTVIISVLTTIVGMGFISVLNVFEFIHNIHFWTYIVLPIIAASLSTYSLVCLIHSSYTYYKNELTNIDKTNESKLSSPHLEELNKDLQSLNKEKNNIIRLKKINQDNMDKLIIEKRNLEILYLDYFHQKIFADESLNYWLNENFMEDQVTLKRKLKEGEDK